MDLPLTERQFSFPIAGRRLDAPTLGALLAQRTTLLVFLRHYG